MISRAHGLRLRIGCLWLSIGGLFVAELVDIGGEEARREACAVLSMPSSLQLCKLSVRRQ
jgi:hypothetical protein